MAGLEDFIFTGDSEKEKKARAILVQLNLGDVFPGKPERKFSFRLGADNEIIISLPETSYQRMRMPKDIRKISEYEFRKGGYKYSFITT